VSGGGDDGTASTRDTQYFEMLGSRGIYHQGWKAVTWKPLGAMYSPDDDPNLPFDDDVWELYNLDEDPSECHDLADDQPGKLKELVEGCDLGEVLCVYGNRQTLGRIRPYGNALW